MKIAQTFIALVLVGLSLNVASARKGEEISFLKKKNVPARRLMMGMGSGASEDDWSLGEGQCYICTPDNKQRPTTLSLLYTPGPGVISGFQDESKATCRDQTFPASAMITVNGQQFSVSQGTVFTFTAEKSGDEMDAVTDFDFDNGLSCNIHTSCSQPLVAGDRLGPFTILEDGNTCDFGEDEAEGENLGECVICDKEDENNKERPPTLTVQYMGNDGPGSISEYQDEEKATCRDQVYPSSATITAYGVQYQVTTGSIFTFENPRGKMDAETDFFWDFLDPETGNDFTCFIHTSCSQPIVVGDIIGPFKILAGNDCYSCGDGNVDPDEECDDGANGDDNDGCLDTCNFCTCQATATYDDSTGVGIVTIDFNLCGSSGPLVGDWIGIYPSDAATIVANEEGWAQWPSAVANDATGNSSGYVEGQVYVSENPIWSSYTCGSPESGCQNINNNDTVWRESGTITIDPSVQGNDWAFGGFFNPVRVLPPGRYKVLLNRDDAGTISPPPYPTICGPWEEAIEFVVPDEMSSRAPSSSPVSSLSTAAMQLGEGTASAASTFSQVGLVAILCVLMAARLF